MVKSSMVDSLVVIESDCMIAGVDLVVLWVDPGVRVAGTRVAFAKAQASQ